MLLIKTPTGGNLNYFTQEGWTEEEDEDEKEKEIGNRQRQKNSNRQVMHKEDIIFNGSTEVIQLSVFLNCHCRKSTSQVSN